MGRLCGGDATAFEPLYSRLFPSVREELVTQGLAEGEIALAAESTFLRLCRERDVYVIGADPTAWVLAIAREEARRHARRRWPRRWRIIAAVTAVRGLARTRETESEKRPVQGVALISVELPHLAPVSSGHA
jgi:DNA-directed RNA polymerase specialized sigma24 family protein